MSHRHFILYKPYGYISQMLSNDARQARKKKFLSSLFDWPDKTMPIGRLDEKSEGLLLLTTDGKLSDTINKSGIEKEYYALVDGDITANALQQIQQGVTIGVNGKKYKTKPANAFILDQEPNLPPRAMKIRDARHGPTRWVSITLKEGKFHQVRKMTAAVGFPTLRLVRIRIGNICINQLKPAEVLNWDGTV